LAKLALLDAANFRGSQFDADAVERLRFKCVDDDPRFEFGRFIGLEANLSVSIIRTSHILGAVGFEFQFSVPSGTSSASRRTIVFSGDLGNNQDHHSYQALLNGQQYPSTHASYIVCESTYGATTRAALFASHPGRIAALDRVLSNALEVGHPATVVFPCFSLQRTQELIVDLHCLLSQRESGVTKRLASSSGGPNAVQGPIEVLVDSPLAQKYGQVFSEELRRVRSSGKSFYLNPELPPRLGLTVTACLDLLDRLFGRWGVTQNFDRYSLHYEPQRTQPTPPLRIVIAGSGMCTGGRVVGHLQRLLPTPNCTVVLTGYQGQGTPGAALMKRARDDGAPLNIPEWGISDPQVKAKIVDLSGFYSGHADCAGLLDYLFHKDSEHEFSAVRRVFLNHGEQISREQLQQTINARSSERRCDDRVVERVELPHPNGAWFDLLQDRWTLEWHPVLEPPQEAFAIAVKLVAGVEAAIGDQVGVKTTAGTGISPSEALRAMQGILQQLRSEFARVTG
jgi:metallo-beta-lactamase family protein